MDIDRSGLIKNDHTRRLSEKWELLLQELNVLNEKKQKVLEIGELLKVKSKERHSLAKELVQLANQSSSFSGDSIGLRDADGTANSVEDSLSWDFEGLDIKADKKSKGSSQHEQFVKRLIADYEAKIAAKEKDIESIQEEIAKQAENSDVHARGHSTDLLQNGTLDQNTLVAVGSDDIELNPSAKIRELQGRNHLNEKRIEELLEVIQKMQNEINLLLKQKEELLQVNHQWDDQYRRLKADKERLASQLREKSGRTREISQVQRQEPSSSEETKNLIQELAQKNEELTQKNEELNQEVARLHQEITRVMEGQKKRDGLWDSAQKMITAERSARETAAQLKQVAEERVRQLEAQLEVEKQTQLFLKQEVEKLAAIGNSASTTNRSSLPSTNMTEQIEMLKQQISVYADDFANERSDRERIQADREALKERLKEFEREIPLLKQQVQLYRDDFEKERRDKERLQRLLRERGVQVPHDEPWYMVPPSDYVGVHQRRQPVYDDRQYRRYSPREVQELAFQQNQQPPHGRGQNGGGHPGGLCHGCEADCDVIDGPRSLKCPRCERVFASKERRAFDDHIDKCTT